MSAAIPKLSYGDIIEIEWLDSVSTGGWKSRKDYEEWVTADADASHWTVGYFLRRTTTAIAVVQSMAILSGPYEALAEGICIPLVAVRSVDVLVRGCPYEPPR